MDLASIFTNSASGSCKRRAMEMAERFSTVSHAFIGVIIYLLLDTTLPYKDEEEQKMFDYGPRPRRRKEAEPIHDQNDSPFF